MTTQTPPTPVDVDIVLFKVCLMALLASFALFVLGIGVIYIGDEYAVPAWRYRALYRQRGCTVALFGVIPIDRPAKKWFETTLVFDRERLQSATDVEGAPEATHSADPF
jgi:hypothetical protein